MKNIFYYTLLVVSASFFAACSNGEYVANPSSNSNGSINPLDPLTSKDFTWTGSEPMSADINGTNVTFEASWALDSGRNAIVGFNGNKAIALSLKDVYADNVYNMGYQEYNTYASYIDSIGDPNAVYSSYYGNSGGVYIVKNDSASIIGLFYFQGMNLKGKIMNISHGYFKISKI